MYRVSKPKKGKRCPSCKRQVLFPVKHANIEVDLCKNCGGIWFDAQELHKTIEFFDEKFVSSADKSPSGIDALRIGITEEKCPDCWVSLDKYHYSSEVAAHYHLCEGCSGIWLSKEEYSLVREAPRASRSLKKIEAPLTINSRLFQFFTGLPVEFNLPPKKPPVVTYSLIAINIFIFLLSVVTTIGSDGGIKLVMSYGLNPTEAFSPHGLLTFLTSMFLHGGLLHIVGNMYFLKVFGDNVEEVFGRSRFLVFYLFCGLMAALTFVLFNLNSNIPMVGASGAVAGVMGAYMYIFRRAYMTWMVFIFQWKIKAYWYLGFWLAFNLFMATTGLGSVAWLAHVGGFLAGLAVAYLNYPWILKHNPLIRLINEKSQ